MFERFKNFKTKFSNFWQRASDEQRGITTSEFWLTGVTIATTTGGFLFGVLKPIPAACVSAAVVIGYTISRGLAKRKKANTSYEYGNDDN
jgi:hypothetical protein